MTIDHKAAAERAKDIVSGYPARFFDVDYELARAYLALQQTVDAGIGGMVPLGYALASVIAESNPFAGARYRVKLLGRLNDGSLDVEGTGSTIEAAVRDAANKVAK